MKKLNGDLQVKKIFATTLRRINTGLWNLGNDAFLVIIILVLFATFAGELLFYQYILTVVVENPTSEVVPVQFKEGVYQSVLNEWEAREGMFRKAGGQQYETPFL